ncbi:MAG: YraN family protein [Deltaproteobacteria bacterium]|nr:YraN family protein [Deltaproteobacteria bacterium]
MSEPGRSVFLGRRAEQKAAAFLEHLGYEILDRNTTYRGGELDLVARQGAVLCFVEVRYRADALMGDPLETVGQVKQSRLIQAARQYLRDRPEWDRPDQLMRFDVVGIVGDDEPVLVQNAFGVDTGW